MLLEGSVFKTNCCGDLVIVKYIDHRNVHVKFINTGYQTISRADHIRNGEVKDRTFPSVHGVGILGDEPTTIKGKRVKEHSLWCGMLKRCYHINSSKEHPTYKDCTVSDNFKYYPYFKGWCNHQIGFNSKDECGKPFELDKDILVKGNKVYSEDVCVFVPREINALLLKSDAGRGKYLIGVCYHKGSKKFASMFNKLRKLSHLGHFDTELDAFYAYKKAKEAYIKEVAEKWKDQIDPRVYEALMKYQVEITD